jgi:hypothetical protein
VITAREIAAWRTVAPWATDMIVEQDYLLCRAVAAISEDAFLSAQVAMRGGAVLHKGHLAPASRYSEDIDLVLVGDRPSSHKKSVDPSASASFGNSGRQATAAPARRPTARGIGLRFVVIYDNIN